MASANTLREAKVRLPMVSGMADAVRDGRVLLRSPDGGPPMCDDAWSMRTETKRNGTNGASELRRTIWIETMQKCADLPHFGTFVYRKRLYLFRHVSTRLDPFQ